MFQVPKRSTGFFKGFFNSQDEEFKEFWGVFKCSVGVFFVESTCLKAGRPPPETT